MGLFLADGKDALKSRQRLRLEDRGCCNKARQEKAAQKTAPETRISTVFRVLFSVGSVLILCAFCIAQKLLQQPLHIVGDLPIGTVGKKVLLESASSHGSLHQLPVEALQAFQKGL